MGIGSLGGIEERFIEWQILIGFFESASFIQIWPSGGAPLTRVCYQRSYLSSLVVISTVSHSCLPSPRSELPAFLVKDGGLNSGFMLAHCTAAALVSENKTLCHPARCWRGW